MKYINTLDKYYLAENSLASSSTKYDHCIRAILPTNSHIMNKQNCLHQKKSIIEVLWTSLKTPWIGIKCLKISVKTTRIGIGPKTCGFFLSLPTKFDESIYRTFCSRIQCGLCAQTVVLKIYASCLTPKNQEYNQNFSCNGLAERTSQSVCVSLFGDNQNNFHIAKLWRRVFSGFTRVDI